ncbi:sigma 54-interacting transcriptional regulator [Melghirimyces algeriensis]|uniref:Sigma 54 modulation protein n=1 Tax=Melghirimyces algeriensis TaxID=910412 RepID=A0A521E1C2_9BACL|nr:sigma 54-interacting transcriptional regulator [Melghirimyces algeriensis]SMO77769.1 sigma 54 modulation protein [Melghirimyces algeriensis]
MKKIDLVEQTLYRITKNNQEGTTAEEISSLLHIDRSTASRYLNQLVQMGVVEKHPGRPVRFSSLKKPSETLSRPNILKPEDQESLQPIVEKAKAALLYPPRGLPILLYGETGVGKSYMAGYLAEVTAQYLGHDLPFVSFNCAEYAQNPQLLMGHLFGVKKGAFTGADTDRSGLVQQANGGLLFLDEIHRLPEAGQEMLFHLIDSGYYRRLGESKQRNVNILLIGATTQPPDHALLPTLSRRFPVKITLPPLRKRSRQEREQLVNLFLSIEGEQMGARPILEPECREAFLTYDCRGNVGQLKSDIQIACAQAFLRRLHRNEPTVTILPDDLPHSVRYIKDGDSTDEQPSLGNSLAEKPPKMDQSFYDRLVHFQHELESKGLSAYEKARKLQQLAEPFVQSRIDSSQFIPAPPKNSLLEASLMDCFRKVWNQVEALLERTIPLSYLTTLALHIQAWVKAGKPARTDEGNLSSSPPPFREAAELIAQSLLPYLSDPLPEVEVNRIARLLQHGVETPENGRIAVLVAAHGDASASSMADVANALMGEQHIHAVDIPLHQPTTVAYNRLAKTLREIDEGHGVLMLVDLGSLTTMGESLSKETGIAVSTIADVHLSMVIDAGRRSLLPGWDLPLLTETIRNRSVQRISVHQDDSKQNLQKRRLIATVCLTGEGAALTLDSWLQEHLSTVDDDVEIRPVQIDLQNRRSPLLEHLRENHQLLAVVGTVQPDLPDVPFFPAWELLQPEGVARLEDLLKKTRDDRETESEETSLQVEEIPTLVEQGLMETTSHLNPRLFCRILKETMPSVRQAANLDPARETGLWMHLGALMDRLIQGEVPQRIAHSSEENQIPFALIKAWTDLLNRLSSAFSISFPDGMAEDLSRLSVI